MQFNPHQPTSPSSNLEPGLPLLIGTSTGGRSWSPIELSAPEHALAWHRHIALRQVQEALSTGTGDGEQAQQQTRGARCTVWRNGRPTPRALCAAVSVQTVAARSSAAVAARAVLRGDAHPGARCVWRCAAHTFAGGPVQRPGMVRVAEGGGAVDMEIWMMPARHLAASWRAFPPR